MRLINIFLVGATIAACVGDAGNLLPGAPLPPADPPVTATVSATTNTPATGPVEPAALVGTPFVPMLTGHRLAIADDIAIVADPDGPGEDGVQPQLHLASITQRKLLASLTLPVGSNPQAVAVASSGYAYVLTEGLGGVMAVDIAHATLGAFENVCDAPMDLATRGADVIVACRGGEVATLSSSGLDIVKLRPGLRRIAVDAQNHVFVATMAGEVIEVGVPASTVPPEIVMADNQPVGENRVTHANTPHRLLPLATGGVMMVYQQSMSGELAPTILSAGNYYNGANQENCPSPPTRSMMVTTDGSTFGPQLWIPGTHVIDAALSPSGKVLAVADVGGSGVRFQSVDPLPVLGFGGTNTIADGSSLCAPSTPISPNPSDGIDTGSSMPVTQPTGVAFSGRTLVVLNAQPLELQTVPDSQRLGEGQQIPASNRILLRPRTQSPLTEGIELFHSDPNPLVENGMLTGQPDSNTLACASCHPDGLTNGGTTTFNGTKRRVMSLAGHLKASTLFHWVGKDFHTQVIEGTWRTNMAGPELTVSQETSLLEFVRQLKAPAAPAASDAALVEAGRAAFEKGQCGMCHVPETEYTNDTTADIGRGLHKVPSLVGLVYTAPYMSDGCAQTLEDRFNDPTCGGAMHGALQNLTPNDVTALIAFLKTL